jgi:hypothetical protein
LFAAFNPRSILITINTIDKLDIKSAGKCQGIKWCHINTLSILILRQGKRTACPFPLPPWASDIAKDRRIGCVPGVHKAGLIFSWILCRDHWSTGLSKEPIYRRDPLPKPLRILLEKHLHRRD